MGDAANRGSGLGGVNVQHVKERVLVTTRVAMNHDRNPVAFSYGQAFRVPGAIGFVDRAVGAIAGTGSGRLAT